MKIIINDMTIPVNSYSEGEILWLDVPDDEGLSVETLKKAFSVLPDTITILNDDDSTEAIFNGYKFLRSIESIYGKNEYYAIKIEQNDVKQSVLDSASAITDIQEAMTELYEMIIAG